MERIVVIVGVLAVLGGLIAGVVVSEVPAEWAFDCKFKGESVDAQE